MPCNGRHLQHRDRGDSSIVLMACTQQQGLRLLDAGLLKMYADFYSAFFPRFLAPFQRLLCYGYDQQPNRHTHTHASVAGRNDKILFLIFCCVLYCIAHGNRRHYGSWKQRPQTEKKADEHGKRPTPKSLRTFAGRTIERTHSNLAANTHTYTADETRENVFFILIFKKGTPFVIYVQAHNSSAVITWMAQKKKRRRACMQKENFNERFSS